MIKEIKELDDKIYWEWDYDTWDLPFDIRELKFKKEYLQILISELNNDEYQKLFEIDKLNKKQIKLIKKLKNQSNNKSKSK